MLQMLGAKGFRPFFLGAGWFAVVVVPLWVLALWGGPAPTGLLRGVTWHAHEMIFGFTVAVIAGFLLTAVENWTGRTTVRGPALLGLAALWVAARVLLFRPGWVGPLLDLALLPGVALAIGRPLWQTWNTRNLPLVGLLGGLWLADLAVYADASGIWPGLATTAHRVAVHMIAVIILVVAGRVVPMFTRNGTGDSTVSSFAAVDRVAILSTLVVAVLQPWANHPAVAVLATIAGVATLVRMVPWWTSGVLAHPLLWVLHLGHASVGFGLMLTALPALGVQVGSSALHLLTVGGIGLLTLGMMARVSLGHTGRPLEVGLGMSVAFVSLALAAVVRAATLWSAPDTLLPLYALAAGLWSLGFLLFIAVYTPILLAPRTDGKPG